MCNIGMWIAFTGNGLQWSRRHVYSSELRNKKNKTTLTYTYTFLNQQTIFQEEHERRGAVWTVVQQSHHALWVHWRPCVKLQGDRRFMLEG